MALPRVPYRRRDALLALVPYASLWLVALAPWRVASLPHRDWRPRGDELAPVRFVPGTPYYVLARGHADA